MTVINISSLLFMILCAVCMVSIGLNQWRSSEPVPFWSRQTPPKREELTDVEAYNRLHGLLWMLFGGILVVSLIIHYFTDKAHTGYTLLGGIVVMLVLHKLIERLYQRKP